MNNQNTLNNRRQIKLSAGAIANIIVIVVIAAGLIATFTETQGRLGEHAKEIAELEQFKKKWFGDPGDKPGEGSGGVQALDTRQNGRLDTLENLLKDVKKQISSLNTRVGGLRRNYDQLGGPSDPLDGKVNRIKNDLDKRIDKVETSIIGRFDRLELDVDKIRDLMNWKK